MSDNTAVDPQQSPEIGQSMQTGTVLTNYHDLGRGSPVLLIHGSGPGVSAWANWRLVLPELGKLTREIAPDMAGFGYSKVEGELSFSIDMWLNQLSTLLEGLGIDRVSIVGNSYGGGIALHFASMYPDKVDKIVLMGSVGASFPLTDGLDRVWGYGGSREEMHELIGIFAYNKDIVTDDLVDLRYQASMRDDVQERFSALFPAPRQRWIEALKVDEVKLKALAHEVLLIHGKNDEVIPLQASESLNSLIPNSRLLVIDKCGHWVQIEHTRTFIDKLISFLNQNEPK